MVSDFKGCPISEVDHSSVTSGGNGMKPGTPWSPLLPYSAPAHPGGVSGESLSPPKSGFPSYYLDQYGKPTTSDSPFLYQEPVTKCDNRYMVLQCGCGRHIVPSTCMSLRCVKCAPFTGRRRSQSVFDRIRIIKTQGEHKQNYTKTVIYTVFTTPQGSRQSLKDPKEWQSVRLKAWKVLREKFGALYGFEASHPIGDNDNKFHPHLNFIWVQRKGWSPYIDVNSLRLEWSAILGVKMSDVYSQYSESPRRIRFWCNYVTRIFPGFHWWTGRLRWYGKYPKKIKFEQIICSVCKMPFQVVGYIYGWLVDEYYKDWWKNGIDPPWLDDKNIIKLKSNKKMESYV